MAIDWTVIKSLNENRAAKLAAMKALLDKADAEKRALNADESAKWDTLKAEAEALKAQVDRHNSLYQLTDEQRAAAQNPLDVPEKDIKRYSLLRAIQLRVNNQPLDGIEGEMSAEIAKRNGKAPQGFYVPLEALATRALDSTTGAGAKDVQTLNADFITRLRAKTLSNQLGVRIMSGLVGELSIPAATAGATAAWVAEGAAPTGSNMTIGQVALKPNTISAFTDVTRKFLHQTSLSAEQLVRDDLTASIAVALDTALFNGSGQNNQPLGILQNIDVSTVAIGATGGALDFATVVALETAVATQNADVAMMNYVTNSKTRGKAKTTLESSTAGAQYIWHSDSTVNGYSAYASNLIPSNLTKSTGSNLSAMIFGNWNDAIIALWGAGLDVLVDPYTLSSSGGVRIVALEDATIALRHAESFSKCVDIATV